MIMMMMMTTIIIVITIIITTIIMFFLTQSLHPKVMPKNISESKQLQGIDAALYMEPELMSSILNRFPWDVVYQDGAGLFHGTPAAAMDSHGVVLATQLRAIEFGFKQISVSDLEYVLSIVKFDSSHVDMI
jgi:hypothetical protein